MTGVAATAASAGGAGGRRDGEKSGRAWVSPRSPSAIAHSGLPEDDAAFAVANEADDALSEFRSDSCAAALAARTALSSAAAGTDSPDFLIVARLLALRRGCAARRKHRSRHREMARRGIRRNRAATPPRWRSRHRANRFSLRLEAVPQAIAHTSARQSELYFCGALMTELRNSNK